MGAAGGVAVESTLLHTLHITNDHARGVAACCGVRWPSAVVEQLQRLESRECGRVRWLDYVELALHLWDSGSAQRSRSIQEYLSLRTVGESGSLIWRAAGEHESVCLLYNI